MEDYFFIPVNSLNFNNILSSESLSPPSFYEKRGFGFKRFEHIVANPFLNTTLAYSKIIELEAPKSEREEFPIYLAVPKSYFNPDNEEVKTNGLSIIQVSNTIYINWEECFFVVKNEIDKKKIIAGTKRSLEAKHSQRYLKNIYLLKDFKFETEAWNESILETVSDLKNLNQNEILKDQKLNKVKGFLYGYVLGKLKEKPAELTEGKRYFQEFVNTYSALMNELSVLSNESKKVRGVNHKRRIENEIGRLVDLKERISLLFGGNEEIEVENAFKSSFGIDEHNLELFKSFKYGQTRASVYSIVSAFLKEKNKELYAIDELMDTLIQKTNSFVKYNSFGLYKSLEETFNSIRILIERKISIYEKESVSASSLDKIPFAIGEEYSVEKIEISGLENDELNDYDIVIKELLTRFGLSTSDEIAQQRFDIIQHIAKELSKLYKSDSEELEFLRRLFKSLKTVGVGFKISETSNIILQSLACFLSRYQNIEKLQDFMEKNKYQNYGLTYSLWGAAYGYANMSKILLETFESNKLALDILSDYIESTIRNRLLDKAKVSQYLDSLGASENTSITMEWDIENENTAEEPKETYQNKNSFIESIKTNSNLNKNPNWIQVLDSFYYKVVNENKGGTLFGNDDKIKSFKTLLKEEKKNKKGALKGFGDAKIDEAVLIFSKHIN